MTRDKAHQRNRNGHPDAGANEHHFPAISIRQLPPYRGKDKRRQQIRAKNNARPPAYLFGIVNPQLLQIKRQKRSD
ncbi:hypothetical protein D3C79_937240 [compost metagenome]